MFRKAITLTALLIGLATPGAAADGTWTTAWYASPQPVWSGDFPLPVLVPTSLWNQTVRHVVKLGVGGTRIRVAFSNTYGAKPIEIAAAAVAPVRPDGSIDETQARTLTFSGKPDVVMRKGAPLVSDPLDMTVSAAEKLAVSFYLPRPSAIGTFHWEGLSTGEIAPGNLVGKADFPGETTTSTRILLSEVLVETAQPMRTIVAIGDSITDGAASTPNTDSRWPDFLAARLAPQGVAVVNAGISGGRLLRDLMGESALARFDRDVLARPNVKAAVVLIGINDISWPGHMFAPDLTMPSRDELVEGYRQLIARAHAANIRIIGATLTPFEGALQGTPFVGYWSEARDRLRHEINDWIRTSGEFDAVVDLDEKLRDPANPSHLKPEYDSGDHLHASDHGNKTIAEAMTLEVLLGAR